MFIASHLPHVAKLRRSGTELCSGFLVLLGDVPLLRSLLG